MRFNLTDLRLFLAIAETGSITHGAGRANLALASASARVHALEQVFRVRLLDRGRRGATPTPAGRALARHARLVLAQVEALGGELGEYARGAKGRVRLLCNTAALAEFVPERLATFLAAEPDTDVEVEEQPSQRIVRAIAEGGAEIGIVSDAVDLAGLETFAFRTDQLVLAVPDGHALARRRSVLFREALDHPLVGLGAGSALQEHLADQAARLGRLLHLRARLPGFEAVCRLVERGAGLAVLPETAARRCRRTMAIAFVRLADPWALRRLMICVRGLAALPSPARRLVSQLAASPPNEKIGPPRVRRAGKVRPA
jgi:DNA-binding transcriptional LysR family regulator